MRTQAEDDDSQKSCEMYADLTDGVSFMLCSPT